MKKSVVKKILSHTLVFLIGASIPVGFGAYYKQNVLDPESAETQDKIEVLQSVVASNTRNVYIANEELLPGMILTEDKVSQTVQYASGNYNFITEDDFGKIVTQAVSTGETVSRYALSANAEFDSRTRLVWFDNFMLADRMVRGDYIDVRIRFKNGEDYIVLSKKRLNSIDEELTSCYLSLSEEEIQMMASAQADVVRYGAKLYSVLYEEDMQSGADCSYIPAFFNQESFPTIYSFENEQKRMALESRMADVTPTEEEQ